MIKVGDILYVQKGKMGSEYNGMPVIICEVNEFDYPSYEGRYQIPGHARHAAWYLSQTDINYYLETR